MSYPEPFRHFTIDDYEESDHPNYPNLQYDEEKEGINTAFKSVMTGNYGRLTQTYNINAGKLNISLISIGFYHKLFGHILQTRVYLDDLDTPIFTEPMRESTDPDLIQYNEYYGYFVITLANVTISNIDIPDTGLHTLRLELRAMSNFSSPESLAPPETTYIYDYELLTPPCTLIDLSSDKLSANIGDTIVLTAITEPSTEPFIVEFRDQEDNLIGQGSCTTSDGTCSINWNTTGTPPGIYTITASVGIQCTSSPITITLQQPIIEAGFGGVTLLLIGGLAIGMMLLKKECKNYMTKEKCEKAGCRWIDGKCIGQL